ncbi:MAG: 2-succinyl-5-enolpyruvyl-6-hydroxy-3-cyclohexene-1-carboxylic-acid synthase [Marinifilaceae bacterium]
MNQTYSDKTGVKELIDICVAKGMERVVISPGSRNAPLSISFSRDSRVESLVIVDERSAAFFALGMAQQTGKPVGLVCTSGTALLNYAPAIAEAYYQRIPLVVISADRPEEWIDQDDSQAIRQENVFANYIKASYQVPVETEHKDDRWYLNRMVNEAFNKALSGRMGPVHINIPLREPLYGLRSYSKHQARILEKVTCVPQMSEQDIHRFADRFNSSKGVLVLAGLHPFNEELNGKLKELSQCGKVVVLTENIANLQGDAFIPCIDRIVSTISEAEAKDFQPDLLISFGGPLISKMVKTFLRKFSPANHWYLGTGDDHIDTFQNLSAHVDIAPVNFFRQLVPLIKNEESVFGRNWKARNKHSIERHTDYLESVSWSDLKAFEILLQNIPAGNNLQLSNSSVVRYAQLFTPTKALWYNSNRGTSGIDGCTSTAAGAAWVNERSTTLITGDVSFFYDSNALWNKYLSPNLRIIVISNGGGGIFRFIPGPSDVEELDEFFEAAQDLKAEKLATAYDLHYFSAGSPEELKEVLPQFYAEHENAVILEVKTPRKVNDIVLKEYFKHLKPEV